MGGDDGSVMAIESLEEHFSRTKIRYETLFNYIYHQRQELVIIYKGYCKIIEIIGKTMGHLHPAERIPLEAFENEQIDLSRLVV
jgi:hypothetical protein